MTVKATEKTQSPKQNAILEAALVLFSEKGFDGTPVPLVAEKAGVGAGTIYRYFESKEALVNALYQHWKSKFIEGLTEFYSPELDSRAKFAALWKGLVTFARSNPVAFSFLEMHHHTPYLDEKSAELTAKAMDVLRNYLLEGRAAKELKDLSPDFLIAFLFGAFVGVFKSARGGRISLDQATVDAAEECCWRAIRVEG